MEGGGSWRCRRRDRGNADWAWSLGYARGKFRADRIDPATGVGDGLYRLNGSLTADSEFKEEHLYLQQMLLVTFSNALQWQPWAAIHQPAFCR